MKNNIDKKYLNRNYFLLSFIFLVILTIFVPHRGHNFDTFCWRQWSIFSATHGLQNIYFSDTDYLPLYHYVLFLFGKIAGSAANIEKYIYYLKPITLIFHFVSGFFALQLIKDLYTSKKTLFLLSIYVLLNAAIVYNALFWGQVDDIFTCFVFISFYFAYKKRVLISLLSLLIAINFKLQAIIFIPFIGLMLLPSLFKPFSAKKWILWVFALIMLQTLILLPFIYTNTVEKMWFVVTNSFGKYPVVSMFAFNFWDFIFWSNTINFSDQDVWLNLTYKRWGLLLFFISSGAALWPLIKNTFLQLFKNLNAKIELDHLLLIGALIPLLFFFFNTQMHERYSHPALIFVMVYSIRKKEIVLPIILSLAYINNLIMAQHFEQFADTTPFNICRRFSAIFYLIGIIMLYIRLFNFNLLRKNLANIAS